MSITKDDIITAFKNSCVLLTTKSVLKRSIAVKYQFQRNIWEVHNDWLGLIRIEDKINRCEIRLFPLTKNGFHLKIETVFEITKNEFEELRKLYFGDFKEDKNYLKKINKLWQRNHKKNKHSN